MDPLEAELARARDLDVAVLADAVESIGFECTRCGACCRGDDGDPHTATVFPDEVRTIRDAGDRDWRDVAHPMPFGLSAGPDGPAGETFEWALATDDCGDCAFYAADGEGAGTPGEDGADEQPSAGGDGRCTIYDDRPLICRTYPFSVALDGTSQPMGAAVESAGVVRAHECEGLGRDIDRADALAMARTLRERAVTELEEAIAVRDAHAPADPGEGEVVVHDSEGAKRPDGTPYPNGPSPADGTP